MNERSAAARRRWAGVPAADRRANLRAATAESARLRREALLEGVAMADRLDGDVLETATAADSREAHRLAGPGADVHAVAHELRRLYVARDIDHNTIEGTPDEHRRRNEKGAERANARPQEANGHRPRQGNA